MRRMRTKLQAVTKEALALPAGDQAMLAEKIVRSLVTHVPAGVKRKHLAEVMRRRSEVLSGKVKGVSAAQVIKEIEALLA